MEKPTYTKRYMTNADGTVKTIKMTMNQGRLNSPNKPFVFDLTYENGLITFNSGAGYNFHYTYSNGQLTEVTSTNPEVSLEKITYTNGKVTQIENRGVYTDDIATFSY